MSEKELSILCENIAERARESLRNWDINQTIAEVRKSPEIEKLNAEIEQLKIIDSIFTKGAKHNV